MTGTVGAGEFFYTNLKIFLLDGESVKVSFNSFSFLYLSLYIVI